VDGDANLVEVRKADGPRAFLACRGECREQESCENRNDSDDDEKLNERKGVLTVMIDRAHG
jgi:hypothetical protein